MVMPSTEAGENFVTITRLLALSVVLLVVNISEGIERDRANVLAIIASLLSLILGAVGVVDRVLRAVVLRIGFIAVEWLQIFELLVVSALCTAIAVRSDQPGRSPAEPVSVAMALTTGLLIRVDLTLVVRVASTIYFEKLMAAAQDLGGSDRDPRARSMMGASTMGSSMMGQSMESSTKTRVFDDDEMKDIEPPRVSSTSVLLVHILAALALPAPLVGAFLVADNDAIITGHLVAVLLLAWIRVGHSFVLAMGTVRMIQGSTATDDEEIHDLESQDSLLIPGAIGLDGGGGGAMNASAAGSPGNEPFGIQSSSTNPTFDLGSTTGHPTLPGGGTIGLTRHGSTLGPSSQQGLSLHTLSTTATFRNKALTIRNKDEVSETVRENKPNYRLGMVLGRGGFSTVYAAMNSKTGELMAAKKLQFPSDDESTERNIQMLQNEVSLMRALDHPHVIKYLFCDQPEPGSAVSALPAGESDVEEFFIVMEYVGGGSLHDLVKNFGELSDEASASFIAQVLLGVEYLHSTGRVHRDMKPGNVLLRSDGHVKISDFGTSLDFRNREGDDVVSGFRVDHMAGTPLYSPPEALRGTLNRNRATREERKKMKEEAELDDGVSTVDEVLAYSVAYDVWGIGCTAMELLTGKRPWAHLSSNALKSLTMLVDEAAEIEKALEDDEWETGGDEAANAKTCPTLPPGLSDNARSFLESCLKVDPMARLNATALLCHPWIQQYDLIDTKASPLHGFVPMGVETGVLSTRASSTSRLSQWNESRLTADQRRRLTAGLAVAATANGPGAAISLGLDPSTMHAPTVREDRKTTALDAAQSAFVHDKDRAVRKNMNRLVHKTRALMRLGAFKAMSSTPAAASTNDTA